MSLLKKYMGKFVVVTTGSDRGVFGGVLTGGEMAPGVLELSEASNCIFWSAQTKGLFGLAQTGPAPGSKVGPLAPRVLLCNVNSIALATEQAESAWRARPWG